MSTKKYVSLDKLSLYDEKIKKVITDGDAAALASAKTHAETYANSLAPNYDAAGAAATALSDAKGYTDGKIETVNGVVAGVKTTAEKGVSDAAIADGKAVKAQEEVDALEAYVGTFTHDTAKSVVEYINAKTDGIATSGNLEALGARVTTVEGKVATIEGDYLKAADKTELEGKINAKADQTALDEVSGVANAAATQVALQGEIDRAKGEESRIEGLVTAEAQRAAGVESGLNERLEEVEAFFKLAEGESLDTALDTLKEIQTYITGEGAAADQMVLDIAANAKAISDMDAAYKAADVALDERLDVLEAINHEAYVGADTALKSELEGKISPKADKTYVDEQVQALQGVDTGLGNRISALEGKFGSADGSVASMIATAKQEAIDAAASAADTKDEAILAAAKKYADDEDAKIESRVAELETASAKHALASDLTALTGRVTTVEDKVGTLETEMDAVEALAAAADAAAKANAAAIALKASQADLEAVSGRVTTLETWHSNFVECSQEDINELFK